MKKVLFGLVLVTALSFGSSQVSSSETASGGIYPCALYSCNDYK
ncbi:hypothetical protein ACQKCU_26205 [Heyndrickxia sporothermodurans]